MRIRLLIVMLVSPLACANTLLIPILNGDAIRQEIQETWKACDRDTWCEMALDFHKEHYIAEATLDGATFSITLLSSFSTHQWSRLQLHLRQDGFVLNHVTIDDQSLNIETELALASNQEVETKIVRLLGQASPESTQRLVYQHPDWRAVIVSQDGVLRVTFKPR